MGLPAQPGGLGPPGSRMKHLSPSYAAQRGGGSGGGIRVGHAKTGKNVDLGTLSSSHCRCRCRRRPRTWHWSSSSQSPWQSPSGNASAGSPLLPTTASVPLVPVGVTPAASRTRHAEVRRKRAPAHVRRDVRVRTVGADGAVALGRHGHGFVPVPEGGGQRFLLRRGQLKVRVVGDSALLGVAAKQDRLPLFRNM